MKTCPNCNALNNDVSKFCEVCGSALEVATPETTVLSDAPETTVLNEAPVYTAPQQPIQTPVQPVAPQPVVQPQYQAPVQPVQAHVQPVQAPVPPVQPVAQPAFAQPGFQVVNEAMLPAEYQPVSIGSYIGHSLLFSLPLIGFIMLIVTACSSSKSKSLRNYAKAMLVMYAIAFVITFVIGVLGGALMSEMMYW